LHDDTFSLTTFQNFVLHAETIKSIVLLDGSGFVKTTPGKDTKNLYNIRSQDYTQHSKIHFVRGKSAKK
jgi:hypothetical protein